MDPGISAHVFKQGSGTKSKFRKHESRNALASLLNFKGVELWRLSRRSNQLLKLARCVCGDAVEVVGFTRCSRSVRSKSPRFSAESTHTSSCLNLAADRSMNRKDPFPFARYLRVS